MTTKDTINLIRIVGVFIPLFGLLASATRNLHFIVGAALCAFIVVGLLCYAWFREQSLGDRSASVSIRSPHA
jgi:hypothetical protein